MGRFDAETAIAPAGEGIWSTRLDRAWNIGANANGGYALTPVLRVLRDLTDHPDPMSVTTHFLRPSVGAAAQVRAELVRRGRTAATARGELIQDGATRLAVMAAFGDLGATGTPDELTVDAPEIPPPERCPSRAELDQGVELPILGRADVRINPEHATPDTGADAVVEGWVRFSDGTEPSPMGLPFFADAFPPSLFTRFGRVGWVPTVELTVHVRRHPAPGWVQARFHCDDLVRGRMIETGSLWDSRGRLVARSRQLGLLLDRRG